MTWPSYFLLFHVLVILCHTSK